MTEIASKARPKILLLDDEQELLEMYRELLSELSSKPEIHTCTSGARALALLESEPFTLLISDLRMPRMDGLQVLSIVRRKYPNLRIVVMTGISDETFRSRAYAMGIDLFWQKPSTSQEIQMFVDCMESLLEKDQQSGFRGVQSKSLVDLIQLESLSHSSSVLKITNGPLEGRIWIHQGDVIDAQTQNLTGEQAFQAILSWRTGSFEILAPDPNRPRTIQASVHGLLLETAQTLDEQQASQETANVESAPGVEAVPGSLSRMARNKGVQFLLSLGDRSEPVQSWGVENPEPLVQWTRQVLKGFEALGMDLHAGELQQVVALGLQQHVALGTGPKGALCMGIDRNLSSGEVHDLSKTILAQWNS